MDHFDLCANALAALSAPEDQGLLISFLEEFKASRISPPRLVDEWDDWVHYSVVSSLKLVTSVPDYASSPLSIRSHLERLFDKRKQFYCGVSIKLEPESLIGQAKMRLALLDQGATDIASVFQEAISLQSAGPSVSIVSLFWSMLIPYVGNVSLTPSAIDSVVRSICGCLEGEHQLLFGFCVDAIARRVDRSIQVTALR